MARPAPVRRRTALGLALLAGATLPGCVYTGLHSQTRVWADVNTYGRPALVVEHVDQLPERRQYVERLRWQYGLGPGRVPVAEPAVVAVGAEIPVGDPVVVTPGRIPATPSPIDLPELVLPPPPAPPAAPPAGPPTETPAEPAIVPNAPRRIPPVDAPSLPAPPATEDAPAFGWPTDAPPPLPTPPLARTTRDYTLRPVGAWMFSPVSRP